MQCYVAFRPVRHHKHVPEAPCSVIAPYRYIGIHIDLPLHCPPTSAYSTLHPPPYLHIDKPKSSFLSWTYPHLSPETSILENRSIVNYSSKVSYPCEYRHSARFLYK